MLLPVRCFTCNRLLADEKLSFYEKSKFLNYEQIKKEYIKTVKDAMELLSKEKPSDFTNELVISPSELKEEYKYLNNSSNYFIVSPTNDFHILNLLGVENYCCRRMYLGYVNLIEKIN